MVEPLTLCTSNALQKFNPIGIGYLGNRKVCLFGGAVLFQSGRHKNHFSF